MILQATKLLAKLAELNKTNLMERANVALDPEKAKVQEENVSQEEKLNNEMLWCIRVHHRAKMCKHKNLFSLKQLLVFKLQIFGFSKILIKLLKF